MGVAIFNLFVIIFLFFSFHPFPLVCSQLLPITNEGGGIDPTKTPVYIVHVEKPRRSGIDGSNRPLRFRDLKNWYMSFLPNATLASGEPRMIYTYHEVITGFAARLTPEEAEAMEFLDGFIKAYPEQEHYAFTTYTPTFLSLRGKTSNTLWYDSSMGAGQIIGVIDSGINPYHPSFNDNGMPPPPSKWNGKCFWTNKRTCNNKLLGAVAFRHNVYSNPYDNDGHGTHVASTAAGNFVNNANVNGQAHGTASGMAPRAHLAIYKVLFLNPSGHSKGTDADIYAAIEQAIRDHVDILQMSLGAAYLQLFNSPVVIGSFAAITKGIVPCAAIANEGPAPSILANDAPWILTVGASTIDRKIVSSVLLGNGTELAGESAYQPGSFPSTQKPLAYPSNQLGTVESLGCHLTELNKLNLRDKIVMCFRFDIEDEERGRNVMQSGGAAMILLNDWQAGETTYAFTHVLPASQLNHSGTIVIEQYYGSTVNPTAAINFGGTQFGTNSAPAVAVFSSRGPSLANGGIIKPDVIAPGVNILAAWPRKVGPSGSVFNFLSGTSMATPHVSGVVALLRNKYPNWSPAAIKSAIMTTAYTLDNRGNPITDEYEGTTATVFERGAGHIDPEAATKPGIIYELNYYDYVHYLCGYYQSNYPVQMIIKTAVNCAQVKSIAPEQLNYPSFGVSIGKNIPDVKVMRKVTNVGDAGSVYNVDVEEPEGVRVEVSPNTLQFNRLGEEMSYEVKFSLKGGLPAPIAGEVKDGRLSWDSGKYYASSPIVVTFV